MLIPNVVREREHSKIYAYRLPNSMYVRTYYCHTVSTLCIERERERLYISITCRIHGEYNNDNIQS